MKKVLLLSLVLLISIGSVFSAPYYDKGNHMFSFSVGTTFPTFTHFFQSKETQWGMGADKTGLKLGGYGGISYQIFNSEYTAIGGEIGYDFNFSASKKLFTAVPFFAKYSYFPIQGELNLPLSVGLGGVYLKYEDASLLSVYTNLQLGLTWFPGESWGFGLSTGLWLIPEFNYRDELKQDNALVGIIPLTLSITYRQ